MSKYWLISDPDKGGTGQGGTNTGMNFLDQRHDREILKSAIKGK